MSLQHPRGFSITSVLQNIPDTSSLRGYASIPVFVLSWPKPPCPGTSPCSAICWPCNIFRVILFSPLFIFKRWCTFSRCTLWAAHSPAAASAMGSYNWWRNQALPVWAELHLVSGCWSRFCDRSYITFLSKNCFLTQEPVQQVLKKNLKKEFKKKKKARCQQKLSTSRIKLHPL